MRKLRGWLLLSTAVAACCVFLVLYPGATMQMMCYVIAIYALALSVGKFCLARSWSGTSRERSVMYVLAVIALAFSASLIAVAGRDDRQSIAVLASYSLFLGLQMLLTMYFLQKQVRQARTISDHALAWNGLMP